MELTKNQYGVLKSVMFGLLCSFSLVIFGAWHNPFSFYELNEVDRLKIALTFSLLPALFLIISVGRLAKYRFFSATDIDGAGLTKATNKAKILQSLIQNTLEQTVIAVIVYLSWALLMPLTWLSVVPLAALSFSMGRILFFMGYEKGATSRAIGFTMTFYPTVIMSFCMIFKMLNNIFEIII
tara:strand:+ start:338 stop:883 length:546 start_codon:yes stop_codon:yes gene_type:complete